MPRHGNITIWGELVSGMVTFRQRMIRAARDKNLLDRSMKRYKNNVFHYLEWLWPQFDDKGKQPPSPEISAKIWEQLMEGLPGKLNGSWMHKNQPFRPLLQNAVHEAILACKNPQQCEAAVADRIAMSDEPEKDLDLVRAEMIAKALERLEAFQQRHVRDNCKFFTVFRVWDANHEQSHEEMKAQLDAIPDCEMLLSTLRKTLQRAREKFGRYLGEDVGDWLAETGDLSAVCYYDAFTNLDLMEYAYWSPYCLGAMGIDKKFLNKIIN